MTSCSYVPCNKSGIHNHRIDLGFGMIGDAWYCDEHLPKLTTAIISSTQSSKDFQEFQKLNKQQKSGVRDDEVE